MAAVALLAVLSVAGCAQSEPGDHISCHKWLHSVSYDDQMKIATHYAAKASRGWHRPASMFVSINGGCLDRTWKYGSVDDVADYIVSVSQL